MGHHPISGGAISPPSSAGFSTLDLTLIIIFAVIIGGWIYYSIKSPKNKK
ncbi:MAG: hypothetical protein IH845_01110 [Nanoarchaeota archaeon]|nr:hypothetical protein [Nanoarchaeota archaeon]